MYLFLLSNLLHKTCYVAWQKNTNLEKKMSFLNTVHTRAINNCGLYSFLRPGLVIKYWIIENVIVKKKSLEHYQNDSYPDGYPTITSSIIFVAYTRITRLHTQFEICTRYETIHFLNLFKEFTDILGKFAKNIRK